ncbi:MAG TPA: alanyl-tRNA editing protein [Gaiellaceae bacterium]|jgi:misacylated tRNA(Ala) deacylase|nr:alanyl-tRNA editing protein [Gaiellaceae bacterium]
MTATEPLYSTNAYLREFVSEVVGVDDERHALALRETAFFPTGGGQPCDTGEFRFNEASAAILDVKKDGAVVWHTLAADAELPEAGVAVHGAIDWQRRHLIMRIHTAQHILNAVIWHDYEAQVTGAQIRPPEGRLDFELPAMSQEFAGAVEQRVNDVIRKNLPVRVLFVPRSEADRDPSLIRLKANLIPRSIDPLRVIDIVGLDRQADGGTHVAATGEVGSVRVVKAESKGKANKRIRFALDEAPAA